MWIETQISELHYHIMKVIGIPKVALWTSYAKIASGIQNLDKSFLVLIDGPVSLRFMGYNHWRLQNELSQT